MARPFVDTPGHVTAWLLRASLNELHRVRAAEVENPMTARWRLVMMIDEELHARDEALRKALGSGND